MSSSASQFGYTVDSDVDNLLNDEEVNDKDDFSSLAEEVSNLRAQLNELKQSEKFWKDQAESLARDNNRKKIDSENKVTNNSNNFSKTQNGNRLADKFDQNIYIPNLISDSPPSNKMMQWEQARNIYLLNIDKQEFGGVIGSVIENIVPTYRTNIDGKDRSWLVNQFKNEAKHKQEKYKNIVMSKSGLAPGTIDFLHSNIDTVNLFPLFVDEHVMNKIIDDARINKDGLLNNSSEIITILEEIFKKASQTLDQL
jgi:hypothetical protein